MMVSQQSELPSLRKDRRLVVDRAILEVEDQSCIHPVALHRYVQRAIGDSLPVAIPQLEESVKISLLVKHRHRLSLGSTGC